MIKIGKLEKMEEGPPIDWEAFTWAAYSGQFMRILSKLPCERWTEKLPGSRQTFLHIACTGSNVDAAVALLKNGGIDINAVDSLGWSSVFYTVMNDQTRLLEIMCAAGADVQTIKDGLTLIDYAIRIAAYDMVRVLIANGFRLNTVHEKYREFITSKLEAFEHAVLCCHTAVVALLRVKRAGNLVHWDKFLLREIAFAVWSTRYDTKWQN